MILRLSKTKSILMRDLVTMSLIHQAFLSFQPLRYSHSSLARDSALEYRSISGKLADSNSTRAFIATANTAKWGGGDAGVTGSG